MNQNEPTDHWAILAAELGAEPAAEPPRDKPADQAISPEAPAQQPEAAISSSTSGITNTPGMADGPEAQGALLSPSASPSRGEEPPQPASPRAAERPQVPAAQTKSSWDILAEQLGIPAEQAVQREQSDADAVGLADSTGQAVAPPGVSTAQRAGLLRPSGSSRRRKQQQPLARFGEGIFDDECSADVLPPASAPEEVAKSGWQPAEAPPVELSAEESEGGQVAGQDVAALEPAVTASAQRAADRRAGRRRRKKRRSPETAISGKPQRESGGPPVVPPVGDANDQFDSELAAPDEQQQQVDAGQQIGFAEGIGQPVPSEHFVTGQTVSQLDPAQQVCGNETTDGYRAIGDQEELAPPPTSQELYRHDQSASAEPAASAKPAAVVGEAAESGASARDQSSKHRSIPTWAEAISIIINANLEARARRGDAGRDRRERGGR